MLLDRDSHVLAKCERMDQDDDPNPKFRITDGRVNRVEISEVVQAVPPGDPDGAAGEAVIGRVVSRQGNLITLEYLRESGSMLRRHFRVPVAFESYIYQSGGGREAMRSADLSCGGIAFYSGAPLDVGGVTEIVIPVTAPEPLIVSCHVLRAVPVQEAVFKFGARFADLIHDEEAAIQEAVFRIQMEAIQMARQNEI